MTSARFNAAAEKTPLELAEESVQLMTTTLDMYRGVCGVNSSKETQDPVFKTILINVETQLATAVSARDKLLEASTKKNTKTTGLKVTL